MDAIDRKVFAATKGLLKRWVNESALPAHYQTEAILAVNALDLVLARHAVDPESTRQLCKKEAELAGQLREKLGLSSVQAGNEPIVGDELTSVFAAMGTQRLPRLSEIDVARQLREFLITWYEPIDPEISQGPRSIYGEYTTEEDEQAKVLIITREKMQTYLTDRFPGRSVQVDKVEALRGGYSKGTYIVSTTEGDKFDKFVIRQDRPGLPTGSSVVDEFAALQDVFARGVKVPEPLWTEADTKLFGAAIMAVGFKAGEPGRSFPKAPERRRKWTLSTARLLGSLHAIRPSQPGDVRHFMRETLAGFYERLRRTEHTPHPGLAFGMRWLEQHIDDLAGRPVCRTHGDFAFHNILMYEDQANAALDWEFTQFSDPVEDLSYVRPFIEELGFWDEFITEYSRITGFSYDARAAHWFSVFNSVRIAVCNASILHLLLTTNLNDVALIVAGAKLLQKYEIGMLDAIMHPA